MKNLLKIGFFGIVLFFLGGCYKSNIGVEKKYVPVMPPITTTGEKTLGCYVNGKLWVAFNNPQFFDPNARSPITCGYYDKIGSTNLFFVTAYHDYDGIYQVVDFSITLDKGIGKYIMKKKSVNDQTFINYRGLNGEESYELDETKPNHVEITFLDQQKRIAAGKFEKSVYNQAGDTLKITDGRFDVKFY